MRAPGQADRSTIPPARSPAARTGLEKPERRESGTAAITIRNGLARMRPRAHCGGGRG